MLREHTGVVLRPAKMDARAALIHPIMGLLAFAG